MMLPTLPRDVDGRATLPSVPTSVRRWLFGPEPLSRQVVVHFLSTSGDAFFAVSLAGSLFFAVSLDAARPQVILYLTLTMAPFALVAPVIGPAIDRYRGGPRGVLAAASAGRAVLCLMIASDLRRLLFYPEAFAVLVLGKTYSVAKSALVPALIPEEQDFVGANSRLTAASLGAGAIGGTVATTLQVGLGAPSVLRVGALVYAAAAVAVFRIPRPARVRPSSRALEYEALHTPPVVRGAGAMVALRAAIGFVIFLLGFALRREGEPAWFFGLAIAASGVGAMIGTVVAARLRRVVSEERIVALSLAVPSALALFAAARFTRPGVLLAALGVGVGASAARQAFDSLVQRDAPRADRSRVFARFEAFFQLAWVLGALVPLVARLDAQLGLAVIGGSLTLVSLWYATGARSAVRVADDLRRIRSAVFEDRPEGSAGDIVDQMLDAAERLVELGAPRRAVIQAYAGLDLGAEVVLGDASDLPLRGRLEEVRAGPGASLLSDSGLWARYEELEQLRRDAAYGEVAGDRARAAVDTSRELVALLRRLAP